MVKNLGLSIQDEPGINNLFASGGFPYIADFFQHVLLEIHCYNARCVGSFGDPIRAL
jgi:hypothetical protein